MPQGRAKGSSSVAFFCASMASWLRLSAARILAESDMPLRTQDQAQSPACIPDRTSSSPSDLQDQRAQGEVGLRKRVVELNRPAGCFFPGCQRSAGLF